MSSSEEKRIAVEKLYAKMIELNQGEPLPEMKQFIDKVAPNGYNYPTEASM